jgi:hypothetical protein
VERHGQFSKERVRVILVRPRTLDVVVSGSRGALTLPEITIPACSRHAQEITAGLARSYDLETYCLFTTRSSAQQGLWYSFSCLASDLPLPSNFRWECRTVTEGDFKDPQDARFLATGFEQIGLYEKDVSRGYFGRPGWLEEIVSWASAELESKRRRLSGRFLQLNASATSSLLRLETGNSAVWFKAAGPPNQRELAVAAFLGKYCSQFVPPLVAVHRKSRGWIAGEVPGRPLDRDSGDFAWIAAATSLAELQIQTVGRWPALSRAGCMDVRPEALARRVDPFFESVAELMAQQTKAFPPPLKREELNSLKSILLDAVAELATLAIPAALVHLDFNEGNVIAHGDQVRFIDWAASAIGNPFFTLEYLVEQLPGADSRGDLKSRVHNAYLQKWRGVCEQPVLARSAALSPLLAAFAYAASGIAWSEQSRMDPQRAGLVRSLARRMKREAEIWARTRSGEPPTQECDPCIS